MITYTKKIIVGAVAFLVLFAPFSFTFAQALLPDNAQYASQSGGGGGCSADSGISDNSFQCVVEFATDIINQLIFVLIGVAILVFIAGLLKYLSAGGDETKTKEARSFIVFGIIALFVMMSVWGLTNILVRTFFPAGSNLVIPAFR